MKKITLTLGCLLAFCHLLLAQTGAIHERLYLSLDKDSYLAGESIWISAFCFDVETGTPSLISSVAYVELQEAQSSPVCIKIALKQGRGSGCMSLPMDLPTGNYALTAYTRYQYDEGAALSFRRFVTIYNPLTNVRTPQVIHQTDADASASAQPHQAPVPALQPTEWVSVQTNAPRYGLRAPFSVSLQNNGSAPLSASVSVYKIDSLNKVPHPSIVDIINELDKNNLQPITLEHVDYAGEVIRGHLVDQRNNRIPGPDVKGVSLSITGKDVQYHVGEADEEGNVRFFTSNLYGNGELVSLVPSESHTVFRLVLDSVFQHPAVGPLPTLLLDPSQEAQLATRSVDVQTNHIFRTDTLNPEVRLSSNPLFENTGVTYNLDEYTRFPLMSEVIIEFVKEARFRSLDNGKKSLQVRITDALDLPYFTDDFIPALVLLDGVPVTDHTLIYNYDPALVKSITIFPNKYAFGSLYYTGIVFFRTYQGTYPGLTFDSSMRLENFIGVQNQVQLGHVSRDSRLPDRRNTLFWAPNVSVQPHQEQILEGQTCDIPGDYCVVVEGMTLQGTPFQTATRFHVE